MTMATKTETKPSARDAYGQVIVTAEAIRNAEPATIAVMSAGDVVRQGDLYLVAIDEAPPPTGSYPGRQLAPGSTQGSRHVVEGECTLYTPQAASAQAILARLIPATEESRHFFGPVVLAPGPVTITHPEHGHRTLPAGTYLTTYQRAWADTLRRQVD
jgi:hypothetical protein